MLNYAHGFSEPDLEFLRGLPVRQLVILDRRLESLAPVHALGATLELLHVTTSPTLAIDLTQFPRLSDLSADWRQVRASIASATDLREVNLGGYSEVDLEPLGGLGRLRRLTLTDRPRVRSLSGLSAFPDLRVLGVPLAKDLDDVSALPESPAVEDLDLEGCKKLTSVIELGGCRALRRLNLSECGDLPTLGPLRGLQALEVLLLYGSTKVVDGDLAPIANLPRLRELRMQSRRHYRPSVREIQASLPRA